VVRVNICHRQCLHILHTVSGSMLHKDVVQLMLTPISRCLPHVQSSLWLLEPCVGDNQSISFTKVNEHLTPVIPSAYSMWSDNVLVWFLSNRYSSLPIWWCLFKGMGLKSLSYSIMHYIIFFASLKLFKTFFFINTRVYKYMHVPCCGTGGILRSVEIHVQMK